MLGSSITKSMFASEAPRHVTAAQGARGSGEREVTYADLAEIIEACANFVAQHLRCFVVRRNVDPAQKITSVGNRERLKLRKCKSFRRAAGNGTRGRVHSPNLIIQ